MVDTPTNWYMKQTNKYLEKIQGVENILEDVLTEPIQHPCMKDCEHEDNEIDFFLEEEDDHPSLCDENCWASIFPYILPLLCYFMSLFLI